MGDSNQDPRLHGQQYYQNSQQPQHVFQQQMYMQQPAPYGYDNQMYAAQGNYPGQYQQQYYEQEYDDDDYDNLAAIDKELGESHDEEEEFLAQAEKEAEKAQRKTNTDTGSAPWANGQLSKHAADFWFPECRNCPCCAGFKHGCKCCKNGNGVTVCADPGCVDQAFSQQVTSNLASRPPAPPSAAPASGSSSPAKPAAAAAAPQEVCRFESAGGCRFGANCRFKHNFPPNPNVTAAAPSSAPAGPPGSKPRCVFFQRGNCQFGDNCRNGHY